MRAMRLFLAGLLACTLVLATPVRAAEGVTTVEAAWVKAMETANLEALGKCFAPDAVVWVGGLPAADNTKAINLIFKMYLGQNRLKDIKLVPLGGKTEADYSFSWGTYTATSVPMGGGGQAPTHLEGRYTNIAKKVNGKWVFAVNHLSEEPAQFATPPDDAGNGPAPGGAK